MDISIFTMSKKLELNKYTLFYHYYHTMETIATGDVSHILYEYFRNRPKVLEEDFDSIYKIDAHIINQVIKSEDDRLKVVINRILDKYKNTERNKNIYIKFD